MNHERRKEIEGFLKKGTWFGGLPPDIQEEILDRSVVRRYPKGAVLHTEGEHPPGLMAVLQGRIALLHTVSDDEQDLLHVAGPGVWMGEWALLAERGSLVSALAQTAAEVLVLPRAEFHRIAFAGLRSYQAFNRLALERYEIFLRFLTETRGLAPEERLRRRLADLADVRRLETGDEERAVTLPMTQADLASSLGLSRPNVNIRLRRLQAEGVVELKRGQIRVLDADRLRAAAPGGPGLGAVAHDAQARRGR